MSQPTYVTREQLAKVTDVKSSAQKSATLDRIAQSASRSVDDSMKRHFYPKVATYSFSDDGLLGRDLLAVTSVTVDGVVLTADDYELSPYDPPYDFIEVNGELIVIAGVWGYSDDTVPSGTLVGNITSSATAIVCSDPTKVGVGDLILIGTERMVVTNKSTLDSAQNIGADIAADNAIRSVAVSTGSYFNVGELILVDTERMEIIDIAGNTLTVERAVDGSVLASHDSGADIYVYRTLTVERGAEGTTAASHSTEDEISRNAPPGPIITLTMAEALTQMEQEGAGYARTIGSGEGEREAAGKGLGDIRRRTQSYRRLRMGAI